MGRPPLNLVGNVYGRLKVLRMDPERTSQGAARWVCRCECGNITTVRGSHLRDGGTQSCGCFQIDQSTKHGHSTEGTSPTYNSWYAMIQRCTNPKHISFSTHGERGIKVWPNWRSDRGGFEAFLADMGERPEGMTLDRKNVNGHYTPSNCRWATDEEQRDNRRVTLRMTYRGKTQSLAAWAKETGVARHLIANRLIYGWTPDEVINGRARKTRSDANQVAHMGLTQTLSQWALMLNTSYATLQTRHKKGWPVQEILFGRTRINRKL